MQIAGGIGLFLLGMILMTDGIKSLAGETLRQALLRLAGHPLRAFASGMVVTMVVQSSSATTVTVIGFVSAGLLSFSQAVGVVIGASLGTTGTSWLVSVVGLKFSLGAYALPLITSGALLRLLGRGAWPAVGLPIAGFGLILVGIETLQTGMSGLTDDFQISGRPAGNLFDHLVLMFVGVLLTFVTQSSSAAMATILTALHTDSINFDQAALLVIGASIGTTITSVLAAIGGNVSAKRTALAHVVFNLTAGLIAVVALPWFLDLIGWAQQRWGLPTGAISLAAFHTAFIGLGVVIFLPLLKPFSDAIERLLPETDTPLIRHLDDTVLSVPEVALEATRRALQETAAELFDATRRRLSWGNRGYHESGLAQVREALRKVQRFLSRIHHIPTDRPMSRSHVAQIHVLDHLLRLESSLQPPRAQLESLSDPRLKAVVSQTVELLRLAAAGLRDEEQQDDWPVNVERAAKDLAEMRKHDRPLVLQATALGEWDPEHSLTLLDAIRWLDRLGYHTWRICHYLQGDRNDVALASTPHELAAIGFADGDDAIEQPHE